MADIIAKAISGNPVRIGVSVILTSPFPKFAKATNVEYVGVNGVARDGMTNLTAVENKYTIRFDDKTYYTS